MTLRLNNDEIQHLLNIPTPQFPKYVTQILNLANRISQATRPRVVGQMSELMKEFTGKTLDEWEQWYTEKYPDTIETATQKIAEMLKNLRLAIDKIDQQMIRQWVRDLVIVKTFFGLRFQEAVLKKIAQQFNLSYRLSSAHEEAQGIDGYLADFPISIKPISYQTESQLAEQLQGYVIYYEKSKTGLKIIIPDELEQKLRSQLSALSSKLHL